MTDHILIDAPENEVNQINAVRAAKGQQMKKFWGYHFLHRRWKVLSLREAVRRFAGTAVLSFIAVLTAACAGLPGREVEHGFNVESRSSEPIWDIDIRYGAFERRFCRVGCSNGVGSFYGVYMPVQDEMRVNWKTSDGQSHEAHVPVKSKLKSISRISTLYLEFDGSKLSVVQGLRYDQPGLVGHEMHSLYP